MDVTAYIQQVAAQQGWAMVRNHDGSAKLEIPTEYGRSQVVQVSPGADPDGLPLLFIWSVVCTTDAIGDPYYLLRLNAELTYGALAVRDPHVILIETQLVQTADLEELRRALFYVGKFADDLEKQVHGSIDRN